MSRATRVRSVMSTCGVAFGLLSGQAIADTPPASPAARVSEPGTAPVLHARWADASALTVAPHRLEGAIFGRWSWGIAERVDLRGNPLLSAIFPQVELRVQWWNSDALYLSTRHEVMSPTPFLRLVAKEGAFGLLPPTTHIPWSVFIENALLLTLRGGRDVWFTLNTGVAVAAPRDSTVPVLDFPFAYQRFAPMQTGATLFGGVAVSGSLIRALFSYNLESQVWALPFPEPGVQWACETSLEISWLLSNTQRVELGARVSVAEYPIGTRLHWFPAVDYGWAW